jgi:hypothetical protein
LSNEWSCNGIIHPFFFVKMMGNLWKVITFDDALDMRESGLELAE